MRRAALFFVAFAAACAPALAPPEVAKPAPAVEGNDLQGNAFTLSSLRGQVVLVNHFGTWCPPCRREMPHLVRMHSELAPRGFEVVAIDHQDSVLAVMTFAQEHGVGFPIVFLRQGDNPFRVRRLPTNVLLDRGGNVRLRMEGFQEEALRAAVETLLDETGPALESTGTTRAGE